MLPKSARTSKVINADGNLKRNKSERRNIRFYECVKPVLLWCKLIGFLPLDGLINTKNTGKRFSWKSLYTYYYIPNLIWTTFCSVTKCVDKLALGLRRKDISGIIFSLNTLLSAIFMIKLAVKWNQTLRKIEELESLLPNSRTSKPIKVVKWILFITLTAAFAEFVTYMIYTAYETHKKWVSMDFDYCFEHFFTSAFDWFFAHVSFHCVFGVLLVVSKFQTVCLRNLTDVFVMAVTVYLCSRFSHFNNLLLQEEKKVKQTGRMAWSDLQKQYTHLSSLVLLLDDLINPIIFVSFSCNLIFLCKQIFSVIQSQQQYNSIASNVNTKLMRVDWEPILYLAFSTTFIIMRSTVLSLFLAHHHTLTRAPLNVLHTVPATAYNFKMQRFMDQVFHSKLSLSGLKLFYVTRESILSMVATLITYELVLLQFPER